MARQSNTIILSSHLVQYGIAVNYVGVQANATFSTNGYGDMQANPLYIIWSGCFYGSSGAFNGWASEGYLWSSTTHSDTYGYYLHYDSSYIAPARYNDR